MIESAEEFIRLRQSKVKEEYHQAAHDTASENVWLEVIDRYPDYRSWVAHNKTVPLTILEILSKDPDPKVRFTVAMRRKAGEEILLRLARDDDESVRMRVVYNPKVTLPVLEILVNDSNEEIVQKAQQKLYEI